MWMRPRTPSVTAVQPMTGRPLGASADGWRRGLTAKPRSTRGMAYAATPTVPSTAARTPLPTDPGSLHHSAAPTTTAAPIRLRPRPSRRCSGSRSRAVEPRARTSPPRRGPPPSHTARIPRPNAVSRRVSGPGPPRRDDDRERERLLLLRDVDVGRRVWRRDVPDREVVLREPDGEDVRVAMARGYAIVTSVSRVTRAGETPGWPDPGERSGPERLAGCRPTALPRPSARRRRER